MNVEWLLEQLDNCDLHDEVILVVEDVYGDEVMRGVLFKVITDGTGAKKGTCEVYGKG